MAEGGHGGCLGGRSSVCPAGLDSLGEHGGGRGLDEVNSYCG